MPRYEVRATADLDPGVTFDVADLRVQVGGEVDYVSADVLSVVVVADADDPRLLAYDLVEQLRQLSLCGIWTARRRGVLGVGRRTNGGWTSFGSGDDGLGGVREPRRPLPPNGHLAAELDPPA